MKSVDHHDSQRYLDSLNESVFHALSLIEAKIKDPRITFQSFPGLDSVENIMKTPINQKAITALKKYFREQDISWQELLEYILKQHKKILDETSAQYTKPSPKLHAKMFGYASLVVMTSSVIFYSLAIQAHEILIRLDYPNTFGYHDDQLISFYQKYLSIERFDQKKIVIANYTKLVADNLCVPLDIVTPMRWIAADIKRCYDPRVPHKPIFIIRKHLFRALMLIPFFSIFYYSTISLHIKKMYPYAMIVLHFIALLSFQRDNAYGRTLCFDLTEYLSIDGSIENGRPFDQWGSTVQSDLKSTFPPGCDLTTLCIISLVWSLVLPDISYPISFMILKIRNYLSIIRYQRDLQKEGLNVAKLPFWKMQCYEALLENEKNGNASPTSLSDCMPLPSLSAS